MSKVKGWGEINYANFNQRKAGGAILLPDNVILRLKRFPGKKGNISQ